MKFTKWLIEKKMDLLLPIDLSSSSLIKRSRTLPRVERNQIVKNFKKESLQIIPENKLEISGELNN